MKKIRCPIERIDNPRAIGSGTALPALFGEDGVVRITGFDHLDDLPFRSLVDFRHQVALLSLFHFNGANSTDVFTEELTRRARPLPWQC